MNYFIDPFGCAKNQVDAELMMASLNDANWEAVDEAAMADLIIVNSCGFIEAAKRESIDAVLAWKKMYPHKKILLAGCLAQRYREELEESLPEANGFLGCDELGTVVQKAAGFFNASGKPLQPADAKPNPGLPANSSLPLASRHGKAGRRPLLGFPGSAYVKISEGCNNNCSFCAIPLIRGALRCRPIPDIVSECKQLLGRGIKELCLIGQDLASYTLPGGKNVAHGTSALAVLLQAVAKLPGDFWVRLLYLHPEHFPQDILDIIANDKRFLPYFDIPFQHASPGILSRMGRKGNEKTYLCLLDTIRAKLPDAVIRSTFLAGFPGETEEDFAMLCRFQQQAQFDWLGVFAFSREEGTPAYAMKGRVAKKIALERKAVIEQKQIPVTEKRMSRFVGRTMDVLVEEAIAPSPRDNKPGSGLWLGRLFCQAPEVDGATVIRPSDESGIAGNAANYSAANGSAAAGKAAGGQLPKPGSMVRGMVTARNGFDLEIKVL